ncbi:tRNA pseudouridine(38-40) synthase TruA [Candidatus Clavichlamydia salmonicola]|uniref:tRNA pseudouridine(38-40) synthase TruA n=1 Tax=Candidatus Clavichlamydia salmonicola TaxID=469812 RepID=UPI0018918D57|nr:tRNA pseudouridine(38-40) synthase TruA [Candidatus Clavichlamydia salmonicola]
MTLAYDGTFYGGWQKQITSTSIQETLEKYLYTILRSKTSVIGAGRTDAGVHATEQVAHFISEEINTSALKRSLNHLMKKHIVVKNLEEVSLDFHSRFSALEKEYRYYVWLNPTPCPFKHHYHWHINTDLSLPLMKEALHSLVGTHDFLGFANSGRSYTSTIRTLTKAKLEEEEEGGFHFEFIGNGFLYKMVRNIVGIVIEIGKKRLSSSIIEKILIDPFNKNNKPTAPAKGLFLHKITY